MGASKLHVRGVTYGSFRENGGAPFPTPERVKADFEAMAAIGLDSVRTYHLPPTWLLDLAAEHGLRVMVGIPWEQHVTFLDERGRPKAIEARVRQAVRSCAGHPAVFCYAVGNEIPASIVRWHGRQRVERFIERLYLAAKEEDPDALATYVNYPSTEYLDLPLLDVVAFNVFLEEEPAFEAYLARLQNIAGNRPLLVTETGLDSTRHGDRRQAEAMRSQIRHAFAMGAAGVFVFSWTDEWHRAGADVLDWNFGVVDRERQPKPALEAVREAFDEVPFPSDRSWPRISVIVCTRNGERTLPECLQHLEQLRYPDYEVIVVSDGSTDATDRIASEHDVRLIRIEHQGLGAARNTGIQHASGEIVAFLDDDAYPDADWLHYLAASFMRSSYGAIGGPNIPPPSERLVAEAVAASPGGPIHVLISDNEAEHIPGCNMAFRREALVAVNGFDERFRVAADDVDICWRLQELGYGVGFNAGAFVMHRRRDSVRRYLRQQYEYGKAEALLERKWPSRYNRAGYPRWAGRIYGGLLTPGRRSAKIHYGTWGAGLFQSIYEPAQGRLAALPLMPEWYLLIAWLGGVAALGAVWRPLLLALPLCALAVAVVLQRAVWSGWRAHRPRPGESRRHLLLRRSLTAALHLLQPLARLAGRLRGGLSPWRRRGRRAAPLVPLPRTVSIWSETWQSAEEMLLRIEARLNDENAVVRRGGPFDRWDFEVRGGLFGSTRIRLALEEHGFGRQLVRARVWPRVAPIGWAMAGLAAAIAATAIADGPIEIGAMFAIAAALAVELAISHCRAAMGLTLEALAHQIDGREKTVLSGLDPVPASPLEGLSTKVGTSPRRATLRSRSARYGNGGARHEAAPELERGSR